MFDQVFICVVALLSMVANVALAAAVFRLSKTRTLPAPSSPNDELMERLVDVLAKLMDVYDKQRRLPNDDSVSRRRGRQRRGGRSKK